MRKRTGHWARRRHALSDIGEGLTRFAPRPFGLVPLLPLCRAAAGPSGFAQSTWVGGTGDWNVDANWSPTGVPGVGAQAFITNDFGSGPESHVNVNTNASLSVLVLDVNDTLHVASGFQ